MPFQDDPKARRDALDRAARIAHRWFDDAREIPVVRPVDARGLHESLDAPLPEDGEPMEATLAAFERLVEPGLRNNGHPRMFGYVSAPPAFAGVVGDLVASAVNQNVTSWRSAPAPTEVERTVVRWIAESVGFPADAGGLLVSGGSMANLTALATALRVKSGADLDADGVRSLPREPVLYASGVTHLSVAKAAGLLGLGRRAVRVVPVRKDFTLDVDDLAAAVREDADAGRWPFAVVANAGDVNTGAVDDLDAVADACREHGLWMHVDGAYGGFAARAPRVRRLFRGLDRADSLALDPHKWLFAPLDAGCVLVKDARHLHAAFAGGADYVDVLHEGERESFAFWDHGPELSRRFRALKVWMMLRHHGARALREAVDENVRLASRLAALVDEAPDMERLAPAPLGIVCFRVVPEHLRGGGREDELDALNRDVVARVQRGGRAYVSNATLAGRFAIRACIINYRTRDEDLPILLDVVREAARESRA